MRDGEGGLAIVEVESLDGLPALVVGSEVLVERQDDQRLTEMIAEATLRALGRCDDR